MIAGVARARTDPGDPLEGLSAEQLRELAARATELAEANAEAEAADTPTEEEAAAARAAEAEEELRASAERVGLTDEATAALLDAMEERQRRVTAEVVREVLEDFTITEEPAAEEPPAEPPAPAGPPAASLEDLQEDPAAQPPPAPPTEETPPETPPEKTHWMHRPIFKKGDAQP